MKNVTSMKSQAKQSTAATKLAAECSSYQEDPSAPANDSELCHKMIATAAYYRAEQRGFEAGHDAEDWFAAEAEIKLTKATLSGM